MTAFFVLEGFFATGLAGTGTGLGDLEVETGADVKDLTTEGAALEGHPLLRGAIR